MELQQLRVKVLPLIAVQIHFEKMFSFEDALVEIRVENNQMMHHRARESLLLICIQFTQDNGQICQWRSMKTFFPYPNTCPIRFELYYLCPFM